MTTFAAAAATDAFGLGNIGQGYFPDLEAHFAGGQFLLQEPQILDGQVADFLVAQHVEEDLNRREQGGSCCSVLFSEA